MKKIVYLLLLLVICSKASIFEQIVVQPKFSFGYHVGGFKTLTKISEVSKQRYLKHDENFITQIKTNFGEFETKLGVDIKIKNFTIYFDNIFHVSKSNEFSAFIPHQAEFYSGVIFNLNEKLKITAEHLCLHPLISNGFKNQALLFGGRNTIKISYGY
jgi:hypothetical protein